MIRILLTALLVSAFGTDATAGAYARLEAFAEGIVTLSGEFEQITIGEPGDIVEEAHGQFYFSDPDCFRWDYEAPFPQQIVADGEKLWHYDASLEQVTVRAQPDASESPMLVITRPQLLERFYRILPGSGDDVLEFEPLDDNSEFEHGRLVFRSGVPEVIELSDRYGQVSRVILKNLQRNPRLVPGLFRFEPPEGVDVLEGY